MNTPALIIILIYLVFNIACTLYSTVKARNASADEYVAAKNTQNWLMVFLSIFGIAIAGGGTLGVIQDSFTRGISGVWTYWGAACSYLLFTLVAVKMYRVLAAKFNHTTGSGALEIFYGKRSATLNSVIFILFYLVAFSLQPKAVAAILCPLTGWNTDVVIWGSGILFVLITAFGGMKGTLWLSIANAIILLTALAIVAFTAVGHAGGIAVMFSQVPESFANPVQPDLPTVAANVFTMVFANCFLSNSASVALTAKNEKHGFVGFMLTVICMALFAAMISLIGIAAKAYDPSVASSAALMTIANAVSPAMAGLAGCGIMAAIISSAPGSLMAASNHITEDIYRTFIRPQASDRERMLLSRIMCAILGLLGVILGYISGSIITLFYSAMQTVAPTGVVLLISLFWHRIDSRAAFWSILLGTAVSFGWFLAGNPMGVSAFWPSFAVTIVVLVVLTLCAKEPISEGHKVYLQAKKEFEAEKAAKA